MKLSYRPDIDGLRAISVLAVLTYHTFPSLLSGGFIGVDVFFVISGYLISLIILNEMNSGVFSPREFYRRRLQRIVPALIPVLLSSLIIGWFVLLPSEYEALGKHVAAASTFTSNWVLWSESGYFDTASQYKPLLHLWSLGVEEQFYLVWPVIAIIAFRIGMRISLLILMAVSFAIGVAFDDVDQASLFFLPHYRAWELLVGASLVGFSNPHFLGSEQRAYVVNVLASLIGMALLVTSFAMIDRHYGYPGWPGWWSLMPTVGAGLLIFAGPHTYINRWLLGNKLMVGIGKISFPLYLWHWPLLSFARITESGDLSPVTRLGILALSFLLAWASYRLIEKPLRYSRSKLTPFGLILALLGTGGVGFIILQQHGVPSRSEAFQNLVDTSQWGHSLKVACPEGLGGPGTHCVSNSRQYNIAVLGDSHAYNVFFALAHRYEESQIGVQGLTKEACPPLYGVETLRAGMDKCQASTEANVDYVVSSESITQVYLSSMAQYLEPGQKLYRMGSPDIPYSINNSEAFRWGLEQTIDRLLAADKEVILVFDWPRIYFDPKSCVSIRPARLLGKIRSDCHVPKDEFLEKNSNYRELLYSVLKAYPSIKYWDTSKALCDENLCWVRRNGVTYYADRNHMSLNGSKYLGDHLEIESFSTEYRPPNSN